MSTKDEVLELLAEMRDEHHEAKKEAVGDIQEDHHRSSEAALQMAYVRVSGEIEE